MANCPNCGVHLKKTYWKPNCPNCNVNIFYHGMQERLENDVKTAEISLNKMYAMLDRAKASYIGSKLAIARIVLSLIPIGPLFLPLAKLAVNVPFVSEEFSINAITLYNAVSTMDFEGLLGMFSSESLSLAVILFALSIVFIALGAVGSLVGFILLFLSCSPKGIQRNLGFSCSALACYILSGVLFLVSGSQFASVLGEGAFSASLSFGYPILILLAIAPIVINLMIKKNPIVVKSSAEKRKQEIAEKAAKMAAEMEEERKKQEEQRMIEEAYAAEQAKKNEESK
ncbi:MAG: hypothetical protein IKL16_04760 [Clostridia bacterium]|nr:hypothetical protein [Clostridia bacterium]